MKTTSFMIPAVVIGISLFIFQIFAEENDKPQKKRPDLKQLDKDGDKAISEEEAGPEIWERLGRLDKNGDGKVAGDEFPRPGGGQPGSRDGAKGKIAEFLKRIDKNGDGNISKEEAPEQAWARMSRLDKDGDNVITKEELAGGMKARQGGGDFFAMADKDKDGKLTESEVPRMWEKISKLDRDKDGAISKVEMAAARAYMDRAKGMSGRGKGAGPGGPSAIFGKYDEDKDGKLSKEEVPAELWARLSRADDDADGRVSKEELGSVYKKMEAMNPGNTPKTDRPKRPAFDKTEA